MAKTQAILIFYCVKYSPPEHGGVVYPTSGLVFGWLMVAAALICIPLGVLKELHSGQVN